MTQLEQPEPPRTSAMGLCTGAKEFVEAAKTVFVQGARWSQPTYYLLGHAIELALKAMLLADGVSLDDLKNKYGHNLMRCARSVMERGEPFAGIIQGKLDEIELLNVYYQAKEFEYWVTGFKTYPRPEALIEFLDSLLRVVEPIAHGAYPHR